MFVKIGQATDAGSGTTVAKNCRETTEQSIDIDILGVDDVETKFNEISKVGNIVNTKNLGNIRLNSCYIKDHAQASCSCLLMLCFAHAHKCNYVAIKIL